MVSRRGFLGALIGVGVAALMPAVEPVNLSVPMAWSSPVVAPEDKFALVERLLRQAIEAHDDLIEKAIFEASPNDFCRLPCWIEGTDRAIA